jgi:hypothetical protein
VHKYFKGEIEVAVQEYAHSDALLQTIKYNPKDLKGLKNILPKANYVTEEKEESEAPKSCKSFKK